MKRLYVNFNQNQISDYIEFKKRIQSFTKDICECDGEDILQIINNENQILQIAEELNLDVVIDKEKINDIYLDAESENAVVITDLMSYRYEYSYSAEQTKDEYLQEVRKEFENNSSDFREYTGECTV